MSCWSPTGCLTTPYDGSGSLHRPGGRPAQDAGLDRPIAGPHKTLVLDKMGPLSHAKGGTGWIVPGR